MLWEPHWVFYSSWISGVVLDDAFGSLPTEDMLWFHEMLFLAQQTSTPQNFLISRTLWCLSPPSLLKVRSTLWIFHQASAYFVCPLCSRQKWVSLHIHNSNGQEKWKWDIDVQPREHEKLNEIKAAGGKHWIAAKDPTGSVRENKSIVSLQKLPSQIVML